jgi:membrane protease YdiL (CAAX protease family)
LADGSHRQPQNGVLPWDSWRERGIGWLDVLLVIIVYLLVSVLGGTAVGLLGPSLTSISGDLLILTVSATAAVASVGSVVLARGHLDAASVGLQVVGARWLLIGAGLGLVGWLLTRGVVLTYFWLTGDTTNPQAGLLNAAQGTLGQFALTLLVAGLFVPFGEELLFRGVLYTWLRRWGIVLATLGSALIFGLNHGINVVFPATVVLGLLLALAYERSGSIWPGVVGHILYNLIVFSAARLLL